MARSFTLCIVAGVMLASCRDSHDQRARGQATPATQPAQPARQDALATFESTPPGAGVEVGVKSPNHVWSPGTGRKVCVTPCTAKLLPADVEGTGIGVQFTKEGYLPSVTAIPIPSGSLELGKTYEVHLDMRTPEQMDTFAAFDSNPPGAAVEVGVKSPNHVWSPGTGRHVCFTPCKAKLLPSDIDGSGIGVQFTKEGYMPSATAIPGVLEPGRTYQVHLELKKPG